MKRCTKCDEEKSLEDFYRRKVGKDGRSSQCRDCTRAYTKQWRRDNPERVAAFRMRIPPEKQAEYHSRYAKANPEKRSKWSCAWAKRNPEKLKAARLAWQKANPEKFRLRLFIQNQRGREMRHALRSDREVIDYAEVLMGDPCAYCGAPMEHLDHIVPIKAGGAPTWDNFTAACASCNTAKGAKPLLLFMLHRA